MGTGAPGVCFYISDFGHGHAGVDGALEILEEDVETHDDVATSDVMIAKAGYGTIAEAVQVRVSMLLFDNPMGGSGTARVDSQTGDRRSSPSILHGRGDGPANSIKGVSAGLVGCTVTLPEPFARDGIGEVVAEIMRLAG